MTLHKLAEKLIEAKTKPERDNLLKTIPETDLIELAAAVKEICFSFWTSEPIKARASSKVLESIYKSFPQKEIEAYAEWVNGIAEITRGNLVSAIERLDNSAAVFLTLGKNFEAAKTQPGKLYALALLGRYDEAIKAGKKALRIFQSSGDDLASGKIQINIGNLFWRQDNYQLAEKYYSSARHHFIKIKDNQNLALSENSLAIVYAGINDFLKAEKFYTQALTRAKAAKMYVTEAEIEASMGNLALFRGNFDKALKFLELSRRKYEILRMPHQTAVAELEIADVYLELNLTTEAVSIYEQIADKLRKLKLQGEEARARANFGRVAAVLNQTRTARKQLKKAARLYVLENNKVGAAAVKLNEAKLEIELRNYKKALKFAEEAENFLRQSGNVRYLLTARLLQAEALRKLGDAAKAQKILSRVFIKAVRHEQPNTAQAAQISLGKIAVQQKNHRRAKKHFKQAIGLIETLRAPLAAEEFRMAFLANKLAPFENLAKIYLAENKFRQVFLMIEQARSRSLAESLGGEVQSLNRERNKISAKLSKNLEVLREELNWFYSRLNRAAGAEIENLQTEAKKREKQIADLMRQISSTEESKSVNHDSLDFARVQNLLGKKQALVEFVNFDGEISVFVVTDKTIDFIGSLAKESEILAYLERLRFQFGSLRYGAKSLKPFMPELKKRADFYLNKLYKILIEPLSKFLDNRDLVIIPVCALHYVPFHALFDGTGYLIEKQKIVYSPSATVWEFLASKPRRKLRNALLIGFADERIPLVGREIENLKRIFPESKSFTGESATFSAFTKNAAKFDVLHLACHGQFRPENPMFSSLHLADGFVTVRDICLQKLEAEIVTLSACETGLNKIYAGDEILGLARGFLSAGAKSLILSLWTVNDEAAVDLMKIFYEELRSGKPAPEALKISQCNLIERGFHPYFWSPFALIGR